METGSSDLKIVQVHLEEYDTELAHDVFYSQDRFEEWLYATVSQFLTSKGIVKNAVAVAGMSATLYTMPPRFKRHWEECVGLNVTAKNIVPSELAMMGILKGELASIFHFVKMAVAVDNSEDSFVWKD
ncbi:uncharacterized protein [Miscanthus floridulus]|uniref:uncharacterized protein n=1 Tax=Miscanthus floridulus TaxID=154761 RepID=UPI0034582547